MFKPHLLLSGLTARVILVSFVFTLVNGLGTKTAYASETNGTINSTNRYAWSENVGWLDFGTSQGSVAITDSALTGYVWGENIGWISLNCSNTSSCGTVNYAVSNTSSGTLTGYGWGENIGWVSFNPSQGGVTMNSSGDFLGYAWGENIGWIVFNCETTSSCGTVSYKVSTDWRPASARASTNTSSSGGGGVLPGAAFQAPSVPSSGGASGTETSGTQPSVNQPLVINNNETMTTSVKTRLALKAGDNVTRMAISNRADLSDAAQINYQTSLEWDLCKGLSGKVGCDKKASTKRVQEESFTVYVKFYTQYGQSSETYSDSITFTTAKAAVTAPPEREIQEPQTPPVVLTPTEEKKLPPPSQIRQPTQAPPPQIGPSIIVETPEFFKPDESSTPGSVGAPTGVKPAAPEQTPVFTLPEVETSEEDDALGLPTRPIFEEELKSLQERIAQSQALERILKEPIGQEILALANKFPTLEADLEETVIKIKDSSITLPRLNQLVELPRGTSLLNLSASAKKKIPTDVVFASAGADKIGVGVQVSVREDGELEQKIETVAGKEIKLVVKPEEEAREVTGYIVYKSSLKYKVLSLLNAVRSTWATYAEDSEGPPVDSEFVLQTFTYSDSDKDGVYIASVPTLELKGEYEILTVINHKNEANAAKVLRLVTVIDPEGYVYEKYGFREIRVPNARVSLFWKNPRTKEFELWPADQFKQTNPQITDLTGQYSFLVPEGSYYTTVEAKNYPFYRGEAFNVEEGSGVHANIGMQSTMWWAQSFFWKAIMGVLALTLLLNTVIYLRRSGAKRKRHPAAQHARDVVMDE